MIERTTKRFSRRPPAAAGHRAYHHAARPAHRRVVADGRRASARRLARQRDHRAARDRRHDADDPALRSHAPAPPRISSRSAPRPRGRDRFPRARASGSRLNCLVSGGTGSGKTTFLNILSSFFPNRERIVTIEDAAELLLNQDHIVRLESRPPNVEGTGEIRNSRPASATLCVCGPTGSSSASAAAPRRWTCSRR